MKKTILAALIILMLVTAVFADGSVFKTDVFKQYIGYKFTVRLKNFGAKNEYDYGSWKSSSRPRTKDCFWS